MKKKKEKKSGKKLLKINKNNDITSTIELFQHFENKYEIITATLENGIQYETGDMKITQTFTKTILHTNINKMIKKLKKHDKITIMVIENMKRNKTNDKIIDEKIKKLKELKNVRIKRIKQKNTYKTLAAIIEGV